MGETYQRISYADVEVKVKDGADPFTRVTDPVEGEEFRSTFYDLYTKEDVLEHFVGNCIMNGVEDANRLDGWADLNEGDVTMRITQTWADE